MQEEDALEDMIRVGSAHEAIDGIKETSISDPDDSDQFENCDQIFFNLPSFTGEREDPMAPKISISSVD